MKIGNKLARKFQSQHMFYAVVAVCDIFQCSRLDVAKIAGYLTGGKEILASVKVPQSSLAQT